MDLSYDSKVRKVFFSQKMHCLIDEFSFKVEQQFNFRFYELKNLLYQTMAELFLSEIEILAWLIYLEKIDITVYAHDLKRFLICVGLHAKNRLGSPIEIFLDKFKEKDPEIIDKFEAWTKLSKLSTNISTIELAKKYRELSTLKDINQINYNFYLNDILRSCTIYQKQTMDNTLDLSLNIENINFKKNIFQIYMRSKKIETQEYDLNEFDRIDV
ncbi:hypothetical protein SteCoe_6142 [Stentor coeruleus]|uniref:Uncharacterized protein n=1 Tax=Stentor coeruleus TaxID=5963 RepID=A0A1R2CQS0_9CILI|nr:hypothetical protein SteCoe_6142 [Stentor coeruleus]